MSGEKVFDKPKGEDTYAPGELGGVIKNYTMAEAQAAMRETAAYEAMPDNEGEAEAEETEKMDDEEIASIRAELDEEDDGDEDGEA